MKLAVKALFLACSSLLVMPPAAPQTQTSAPIAASAPTAVPPLIPYTGVAVDSQGRPLVDTASITFLIFKDEQGGEPLFTESQTLALDVAGRYKAQLGATLPNGVPLDLFSTGEARWLEVQIAGQRPQPRVLLVSVPYALKAADAATLGGLPPSAYALAGEGGRPIASAVSTGGHSDTVSNVTTTGGSAGYVSEFSGASTIVNSPIFVTSTGGGIGTTAPVAAFNVVGTTVLSGATTINGSSTLNGSVLLPALGTATTAAGYNSQPFTLDSSAYNSSTSAVVSPRFVWQAEASGNNTSAPSATLNLLSSTSSSAPAETGFHFNANGTLTFAAGQTYPGAGTITGVTAGTGLTGAAALATSPSVSTLRRCRCSRPTTPSPAAKPSPEPRRFPAALPAVPACCCRTRQAPAWAWSSSGLGPSSATTGGSPPATPL